MAGFFFLNSIFLLGFIILIRLFLAFSFVLNQVTFLGLIWTLVYLGGMIIIFVYIVFLRQNFILTERRISKNERLSFLNLGFIFFGFWGFKRWIFSFFPFFSLKFQLYNQITSISFQFMEWEIYNQITSISFQFLFFLIFIITFSLFILLRILKKGFSKMNESSLIFCFIIKSIKSFQLWGPRRQKKIFLNLIIQINTFFFKLRKKGWRNFKKFYVN